jgi:hypothetical protein
VAVRGTERFGGLLDGAMLAHGTQQIKQGILDLGAALVGRPEGVLQMDAAGFHGRHDSAGPATAAITRRRAACTGRSSA